MTTWYLIMPAIAVSYLGVTVPAVLWGIASALDRIAAALEAADE